MNTRFQLVVTLCYKLIERSTTLGDDQQRLLGRAVREGFLRDACRSREKEPDALRHHGGSTLGISKRDLSRLGRQ